MKLLIDAQIPKKKAKLMKLHSECLAKYEEQKVIHKNAHLIKTLLKPSYQQKPVNISNL